MSGSSLPSRARRWGGSGSRSTRCSSRSKRAFAQRAATEEKLRRFLADASHELRTPLTSIRGYAEVFRRGAKDDPEDLATAMRRIEEEGGRMGVMVDELLLLARLGEGRRPEHEPVDLARLADDAVNDARAADAGHALTLDTQGRAHRAGRRAAAATGRSPTCSPTRCATHPTARPCASACGKTKRARLLEVADDGPGMAPETAAKAFEPFFRADPSRTRQTGGAGLGLAIVAAVVEAHGGRVELRTAPGEGATFTLRLPLGAPATA